MSLKFSQLVRIYYLRATYWDSDMLSNIRVTRLLPTCTTAAAAAASINSAGATQVVTLVVRSHEQQATVDKPKPTKNEIDTLIRLMVKDMLS